MTTPREGSVHVNGLRLHYLEWGEASAPWLFLLHGLGSNAHAWDHFAASVSRRWRVIAPHQRGHGDSDWARDGYAIEAQAEDFARLAEALGAGRFNLVGHSMGGMTAVWYAATHPERLERLVIVDIGPEVAQTGAQRIRSHMGPEVFESVQEVYRLMRSQSPVPPDDMLAHRARHAVKPLPDGRWTWKYDPALRSAASSFRRPAPSAMWHMLQRITCPALVVRGADSDVRAAEVARRMAADLPDGRLVEVPGAGHRVPLDNAAGFQRAVCDFLGG